MAPDNKTLGRFMLDGIPPSPRGIPQIEVTFDIDANGILNVKAHDKATGKVQSIRIEASTGLSKEDIEQMKRDAEAHAEEDRRKRSLAEAKNNADNIVYTTEKTLKDLGDKISAEAKKEIEERLNDLKKTKEGDNIAEIQNKIQELSQTLQKYGAELYKRSGEENNPEENKQ
jgi:molecular chaperone DnaK